MTGYTEVAYTGGSKTEQNDGAGVYRSDKNEEWIVLWDNGSMWSIIYAILQATTRTIDEELKARHIVICSNKQSFKQPFDHIKNRLGIRKLFELYIQIQYDGAILGTWSLWRRGKWSLGMTLWVFNYP